MPWIDIDGYRFGFWSADCREPPHVHVVRSERQAKIWLEPVELAWNRDYNEREINQILELARKNQSHLMEMWHDHCS